MLIVVSPAKSLDFESTLPTRKHSQPRLLERSQQLVGVMAGKSPDELASLMGISHDLAHLNHERFSDWTVPFTTENARPAVLAFAGDVYVGMEPQSFGERDFTHACSACPSPGARPRSCGRSWSGVVQMWSRARRTLASRRLRRPDQGIRGGGDGT